MHRRDRTMRPPTSVWRGWNVSREGYVTPRSARPCRKPCGRDPTIGRVARGVDRSTPCRPTTHPNEQVGGHEEQDAGRGQSEDDCTPSAPVERRRERSRSLIRQLVEHSGHSHLRHDLPAASGAALAGTHIAGALDMVGACMHVVGGRGERSGRLPGHTRRTTQKNSGPKRDVSSCCYDSDPRRRAYPPCCGTRLDSPVGAPASAHRPVCPA